MSFGAAIQATIGADVSDLQTKAQFVEASMVKLDGALQKIGLGDRTDKAAKASADAIRAIQESEEKLAAFRERAAFSLLSKDEQMLQLGREIFVQKQQLAAIEKGTLAYSEAQLAIETKILQLRTMIKAERQASAAAAAVETANMGGISGALNSVKEGFKGIGVSIKGAGIGILFAQVISWAGKAITDAQALRDAWRQGGPAIDGATKSLAAFGDAWAGIKNLGPDTIRFLLGGFTQLGEAIGSVINRMRGISEAEENIIANIAEETEQNLARIARRKKEFLESGPKPDEETERIKKAFDEQQAAWEKFMGERQRMADEAAERERKHHEEQLGYVRENREQLILEAKLISGSITPAERERLDLLRIQAKQKQVLVELDELNAKSLSGKLTPEETKRRTELIKQNDTLTDQINIKGQVVDATKTQKKSEEEVTEEIRKQRAEQEKAARAKWAGSIKTVGRADEALSDRELERKIQALKDDIFARRVALGQSPGSTFIGGDLRDPILNSIQKPNLERALAEQRLREEVRSAASFFGADRAFNMFPGLTEQKFNDILNGTTETQRAARDTADGIKALNEKLSAGIPVVTMNGKG